MGDENFILNPNTDQAGIARRNVRIIMLGMAEDVEREILRAHLLRFSEVADWSRPLKSPEGREILLSNPHEVMRIWKRYLT